MIYAAESIRKLLCFFKGLGVSVMAVDDRCHKIMKLDWRERSLGKHAAEVKNEFLQTSAHSKNLQMHLLQF